MKKLNIIGGGMVGKTLGRLFVDHKLCEIGAVLTRSQQSAEQAVNFITQGLAVTDISALPPADITLVSVPDDHIAEVATQLGENAKLNSDHISFHCSGTLASSILASSNTRVANVFTIQNFSQPDELIHRFKNTQCTIEGDTKACATLQPLFEKIGAEVHSIDTKNKVLPHAACVIAANYMVTLVEVAVQTMEHAGLSRDAAMKILSPLMRGNLENIIKVGPPAALSGPIERGDWGTVELHKEALAERPEFKQLYTQLADLTVKLFKTKPEEH